MCSKTCEGGIRHSQRSVSQDTMYGGLDCAGDSVKEEVCYPDPCPGKNNHSLITTENQVDISSHQTTNVFTIVNED